MLVQLLVNNLHAIMFKGCIGAHYYRHECRFLFCNSAQVYYLRPLASSMDCSLFGWHLDHRITQKPSNFHHTPDPPTLTKADNHTRTEYGNVIHAQMQVIKG